MSAPEPTNPPTEACQPIARFQLQAKAIAEHINYVIGMNNAIGDKAAIAFALGFYGALGAGCTIEKAYKFGCVQIGLQGFPEHETPILIMKGQS